MDIRYGFHGQYSHRIMGKWSPIESLCMAVPGVGNDAGEARYPFMGN